MAYDLILKSIENLILYGIDISFINENDHNEYLYQMQIYFNQHSIDLVSTLEEDELLIHSLDGENFCRIYIEKKILRIISTPSEHAWNSIVMMLEFVSTGTELFKIEETEEEKKDDDDDFEWV